MSVSLHGVEREQDSRQEIFGVYGDDWMAEQLPGVLASDPFLRRFLRIFQDIADTVRWPTDNLDHYWRPSIAPIEVARWLGTVLGVEVETSWEETRQRDFIDHVGPLFRLRGTPLGLRLQLEKVTGGRVTIGDTGGVRVRTEPPVPGEPSELVRQRYLFVAVETTGDHSQQRLKELIAEIVPVDCMFLLSVDEDEDDDGEMT